MKKTKKLQLTRQTISRLDDQRLRHVVGGETTAAPTDSCTTCGGNAPPTLMGKGCAGQTGGSEACEIPVTARDC
jgi:natural product precursor